MMIKRKRKKNNFLNAFIHCILLYYYIWAFYNFCNFFILKRKRNFMCLTLFIYNFYKYKAAAI